MNPPRRAYLEETFVSQPKVVLIRFLVDLGIRLFQMFELKKVLQPQLIVFPQIIRLSNQILVRGIAASFFLCASSTPSLPTNARSMASSNLAWDVGTLYLLGISSKEIHPKAIQVVKAVMEQLDILHAQKRLVDHRSYA